MTIIGIVGSPRKDGRTNQLIDAALEGARSAGAEVQKVYLVDYNIRIHLRADEPGEPQRCVPEGLSRLCDEAEAIVLGAPVYWGDINGLTKDFMDSVRMTHASGRPALGTAIAGGSGKGLISGVQSIYHWFYHKQLRGIDPLPVSRFNMAEALEAIRASGARLAELARHFEPFPGDTWDAHWPEATAYYAAVPYLQADPVDEFMMLAEQLVRHAAPGDKADRAAHEFAQAQDALARGDRAEAGRRAVMAYQVLFYAG